MDRVLENVSVILVAHDGFLICQVVQWAADGDHQSEYSVGNYREIAFICPRGSGGGAPSLTLRWRALSRGCIEAMRPVVTVTEKT